MIQLRSYLKVIDNSGLKEVCCIKILGVGIRKYGKVGDVILVSKKKGKYGPGTDKTKVFRGIIVRVKSPVKRLGGEVIKFDDNGVVLVKKDNTPVSSRILGPVMVELRQKGYMKIVSLALICL